MSLEIIPLEEFMKGMLPDAKGFVYSWLNQPFMQLHLFDDDYTLFWLGTANAEQSMRGFLALAQAAEGVLQEHGYPTGLVWLVRIDRVAPAHDPTTTEPQPLGQFRNGISTLRDQLLRLASLQDGSLAYFISSESRPYHINLWAESPLSKSPQKDVGLTSDLPLAHSAQELFNMTSEVAHHIPTDTLTYLFGKVQAQIHPYFKAYKRF